MGQKLVRPAIPSSPSLPLLTPLPQSGTRGNRGVLSVDAPLCSLPQAAALISSPMNPKTVLPKMRVDSGTIYICSSLARAIHTLSSFLNYESRSSGCSFNEDLTYGIEEGREEGRITGSLDGDGVGGPVPVNSHLLSRGSSLNLSVSLSGAHGQDLNDKDKK